MFKSLKRYFLRQLTSKHNDLIINHKSHILFLRYDKIGDMLLSTPVFRELKKAKPHLHISVLASNSNYYVIKNNPYIDHIYIYQPKKILSTLQLLWNLRKKKFDVAIEFYHSVIWHAIIKLRIINPKCIVSPYKDGRYGIKGEELKMYTYTPFDTAMHLRDNWLNLLSLFDIKPLSSHYDFFLLNEEKKIGESFWRNYPQGILINLQGSQHHRSLTFQQLKLLSLTFPSIPLIILTMPSHKEEYQKNLLLNNLSNVQLCCTQTINEAASIIAYAPLIITPDTSIVHIACAFNKKLIAVYDHNPSNYIHFSPQGNQDFIKCIFISQPLSFQTFDFQYVITAIKELL